MLAFFPQVWFFFLRDELRYELMSFPGPRKKQVFKKRMSKPAPGNVKGVCPCWEVEVKSIVAYYLLRLSWLHGCRRRSLKRFGRLFMYAANFISLERLEGISPTPATNFQG